MRDPKTGRFGPGNKAARLRALKVLARHIVGLNPAEVTPWLRPFVVQANADAPRLVEQHGVAGDVALTALCTDTAAAHAVFLGLLAEGAKGDREALSLAKGWLAEHRACVRELKAEAREHRKQRPARPAWLPAPQTPVHTGEETRVSSPQVVEREPVPDDEGDDSDEPSAASPTSPPAPRPVGRPPAPVRPPTPAAPAAPPPASAGLCIHKAHPLACPTCRVSRTPAAPHGAPWRGLLPTGAR